MATGGGIDRPKSRTRGSHRHRHAARWVCDITYSRDAVGNFISDRQRVLKSEPQAAQTAPNATTLGTPFVNWLQSNFGWLFAQAQANATLGQSYVYDDGQFGSTPMLLGEYGNGGTQSAGRLNTCGYRKKTAAPCPSACTPTAACTPSTPIT